MHAVCGQRESQPDGGRVQLDHDAMLVLEIGNRSAAADRGTGRNRYVIAVEILQLGKIVNLAGSRDVGHTDVDDRETLQFEPVMGVTVVQYPVTPNIPDTASPYKGGRKSRFDVATPHGFSRKRLHSYGRHEWSNPFEPQIHRK